jgi:glycine/D-amino acid oxidase-like deaminating enzyme
MNASGPRPSWYETTQVADEQRPRLNFDLDVDVCVIGGGLAGLTAAREVARRGWSVAVLEAGRIAAAASGRSNGFVLPGYSEEIGPMVERIGLDHAKELWALSQRGVDYVRDTIAETAMPGVEPVPGWLCVAKTDNWRELLAYVERLRWMGGEVEAWSVERVREVLPSERYFGAIHYPGAFHLHPLNYALGLARSAEAYGARIFEETPAVELDPAGVLKRIQTPSARVRARHVVLAANVQLGALVPKLAATLMPITTYAMITEPVEGLTEVVRFHGAITDTRRFDNHYRVVVGSRLQWSGCMTTWTANPRRFGRALTASVRRVFPQLGTIQVADLWSGTLGRTLHHMPQIGEIEPGVWVTSGFGRHGLNTASLAGDLVARGIVDNDQTWRLFAPYELVWAGGKLFRAIAQGLYAAGKPVDGLRQGLSRYRERSRRRHAARVEAKRLAMALRAAPSAAGESGASAPPSGAAPMRPAPEPLPAAGSSRSDRR